jgi:hypothetical protein
MLKADGHEVKIMNDDEHEEVPGSLLLSENSQQKTPGGPLKIVGFLAFKQASLI